MLITLKHDITLFMFMMMFNWGPPDFRVILWLSYPPERYLDTIGCLRATSVKWIWISWHAFVFHHILLLDYKTLSQRLARQKQGASMDVSMVSMVWVWMAAILPCLPRSHSHFHSLPFCLAFSFCDKKVFFSIKILCRRCSICVSVCLSMRI